MEPRSSAGNWATQPVEATPHEIQANNATLVAWLVLNAWPSHLGLPILILTTLLCKSVKRHATFINMCVTWMIVGFSSCLLLYAGYTTGPEPPRLLCLVQASLLYGQPVLTSLSTFALVFQVFYVVYAAFQEKGTERHEHFLKWALLIVPYIGFFIAVGLTAYVGATDPDSLSRDRRFFYCSVKSSALTNSITVFSFCALLATTCFQLWIMYFTYKHWRSLRSNNLHKGIGASLSLILRTAAFTTWICLGMGLSILSIKAPASPVPDMALATAGSGVVLIFGTQRDILRALCFWRSCRRQHFRMESQIKTDPEAKLSSLTPSKAISTADISHPIMEEDLTYSGFAVAL